MRMKKVLKKLPLKIIAFVLILSLGIIPVFADEQSDLEKENLELQDQYDAEAARLEEIQANIADLESYIAQLDEEMIRIEENIANIQGKVDNKNVQIDTLQKQADELQAEIDNQNAEIARQYEFMKKRIQFMYENAGNSYVEAIFSSTSFSEAVKKIQYLLELTNYDRQMMEKVKTLIVQMGEAKDELEQQSSEIEKEIDQLEVLQDAQAAQEDLLDQTRQLKSEELDEKSEEAYNAQVILDEISSRIAANQDRIDTIIWEYEQEQERIRQEAEARARQEAEERARQAAEELARQQAEAERQRLEEEARRQAEENGQDPDEVEVPEVVIDPDDIEVDPDDYYVEPDYSNEGFLWPLVGYSYITSYFGYRGDDPDIIWSEASYHYGIDIYAPSGTPILATQSGVVVQTYWSDYIGNTAIIYLSSGLYMEVHHMSGFAVSEGQVVSQGDVIGYVGGTGIYATGPHLHFAISTGPGYGYVNPLAYVG